MLKQGQVLNNRYQIHAVLGQGGFGAVYKVWDDNLQRPCAIKENLQVTPESQKQFKREAVMLANLNRQAKCTDSFVIHR
jgi:serine/threonine protein kinase